MNLGSYWRPSRDALKAKSDNINKYMEIICSRFACDSSKKMDSFASSRNVEIVALERFSLWKVATCLWEI